MGAQSGQHDLCPTHERQLQGNTHTHSQYGLLLKSVMICRSAAHVSCAQRVLSLILDEPSHAPPSLKVVQHSLMTQVISVKGDQVSVQLGALKINVGLDEIRRQ